jgi:capsular exopolysaccharide synthesis family protein
MNEKQKSSGATKELDLRRLVSLLWRKSWLIGLTGLLCAVITFLVSFYLITPKYESSTMFYVNNNSGLSIGNISGISSGDMASRQELVKSYIIILESRETLIDVMDFADLFMELEDLQEMITAESVNGTEIFRVTITSADPYEAERLATAVGEVLPARINNIVEGTSAKIVETAVVAAEPSSPNYTVNTVLGLLIGVVLCVSVIVLYELFDVTIRSEEDVQMCCPHPVLAAVPDMTVQNKGGYYYRDADRRSRRLVNPAGKEPVLVGAGISFAASEAYKLLRTKLQFSFVDDNDCHIIGISSAMAGEGKSLSSVNLAYSLAQLDKRVLLIDCDMRRPSLSAKLPIKKLPGLSNYLTRQVGMEEIVQNYAESSEGTAFNVIAAGRNPPNPIELLNSSRMRKALDQLRSDYDYIILDLPPVGEVSDALAVSKLVDGILLVVRQNYCNRTLLSTAVNQFSFVETRILGVVLNCAEEDGGAYGKYYRGYRRRYSRYEGSYMASARSAQQSAEDGESKE